MPFALTFGHYNLAGIRLTALMCIYVPKALSQNELQGAIGIPCFYKLIIVPLLAVSTAQVLVYK